MRGRPGADGDEGWRPGNGLATAALVADHPLEEDDSFTCGRAE